MKIIALIGSITVLVQIVLEMVLGSSFCPNDGCSIIEGLTIITPIYLNILGLLFFQTVFWSLGYQKNKSKCDFDPIGLALISGLAFEAVLVSYQVFVVKTLCVYCLFIFTLVLLLNLLYGLRQIAAGAMILAAVILPFAILIFSPIGALSKSYSLKTAAYGLKSCSAPTKEVYLFFSTNCSHCRNVIKVLNNCNSCSLYLNPIEDVSDIDFHGLEKISTFAPEMNRLVLSVMGIESIPVLVVKSAEGYLFIKGEKPIIDYIQHACFTDDEVMYLEKTSYKADEKITLLREDAGECSIEIDCDEPNQ